MTMTPIKETHIYLNEDGRAYVKPSCFKVRMIIEGLQANPCPPEEYVKQFTTLTVAEVYAALTYYHDHRAEMDEEIRKLREFAEEFRKTNPESPATKRVREVMRAREAAKRQ
jgi:uncharacterized protein (DUF433 family)